MLIRAAERSASLAAAEEAQTYFQQAAELTSSAVERAELVERTGQMALTLGHPEEAAAHFEEASRLFEESGQTHQSARVQGRLAEVEFARGHLEQALDRMRTAHAVLSGEEPDPDLALVAAQLGRFLAISGRQEEAVPHLEEALELAEHLELPEVYSQALSSRAIGLVNRGRLQESGTLLRHALEVAHGQGLTSAALRAYNNLGVVLESQDRFAEAIDVGNQSIALARRAGDRLRELGWITGAIVDLVAIGRWDEAQASTEEALAAPELISLEWAAVGLSDFVPVLIHRGRLAEARLLFDRLPGQDTDNPESRLSYVLGRARLLRAEGNSAEAMATAEKALAGVAHLGLTHAMTKRIVVEAVEAALDLGDTAKAEELLGIVQRARPGQVTPFLRAHAARLAARLSALRDDADSVEPGFLAAEQGFRDLDTPFDLAVSLLEHAEWLVARGGTAEAEGLLAEAREIFGRLQAAPWVERVDRSGSVGRSQSTIERV